MTYERMVEIISRKSSIPNEDESFEEIQKAYDMAIDCLVELKAYRECPIPIVIFPSGEKIKLTDGHIQALLEYEKKQTEKMPVE